MKKRPITLLLLFFVAFAHAQTPEQNLDKYWKYRDRFLGNDGNGGFIDVGSEAGQSLPMSGRNPDEDCFRSWHVNNYGCDVHKGTGLMSWGDATVSLGYYMAMLSLEYANLKKAKQTELAKKTEKELLLAINAIERLDANAEIALGMEASLNGFFMRDDVAVNFYMRDTLTGERRFAYSEKEGYDCLLSDGSCFDGGVDNGMFMSQDQIIAILYGCSFIKKFAGDIPYNDTIATTELAVQHITHRIVKYLMDCDWRIKAPNEGKISNRWGGDVRGFNNLIARSASRICAEVNQESYQKGSSKTIGWLAKGSFNWGFFLQNRRNYSMIFELAGMTQLWNNKKMAKRCLRKDKVVYSLAYSALNDLPLHDKISKTYLEDLINLAPIDGPCFGTVDCKAPDGWKSNDRWWKSHNKNGNPHGLRYEWSGIDYMFLYNLYHYFYWEESPVYKK